MSSPVTAPSRVAPLKRKTRPIQSSTGQSDRRPWFALNTLIVHAPPGRLLCETVLRGRQRPPNLPILMKLSPQLASAVPGIGRIPELRWKRGRRHERASGDGHITVLWWGRAYGIDVRTRWCRAGGYGHATDRLRPRAGARRGGPFSSPSFATNRGKRQDQGTHCQHTQHAHTFAIHTRHSPPRLHRGAVGGVPSSSPAYRRPVGAGACARMASVK